METLLLRHLLDKLGRTVAAMMVVHPLHCMLPSPPPLSSTEAYRLTVGDPSLQPTLSFQQTGLTLPSPSDCLLASGCGSSTSVQPSFLLNNEVVCPFLGVSGSLTCSIGIPGSLESLELTSGQCWYTEIQSNRVHVPTAAFLESPFAGTQLSPPTPAAPQILELRVHLSFPFYR